MFFIIFYSASLQMEWYFSHCVIIQDRSDKKVANIQLTFHNMLTTKKKDFPGCSDGKESAWNSGDLGSIPGSGRSPGEGNGNTLQYSCLENPRDRGAWQATVHGVTKSWTQLNN